MQSEWTSNVFAGFHFIYIVILLKKHSSYLIKIRLNYWCNLFFSCVLYACVGEAYRFSWCWNFVEIWFWMKFHQMCPGVYQKLPGSFWNILKALWRSGNDLRSILWSPFLDISKSEFRSNMVLFYTTPEKLAHNSSNSVGCDVVESTEDSG